MSDKIIQIKDGNDNVLPCSLERTSSSSGGIVYKFPDGLMILIANKKYTITANSGTQYGSSALYYFECADPLTFTESFASAPYVTATNTGASYGQILQLYITKTGISQVDILRSSNAAANPSFDFICIGRWK